jgi:hypothetical protein
MSRIYPDWIGPTTEYRTASRFPHWIQVIGGVLPLPPEAFYGGVEVLAQTYGAVRLESKMAIQVLSNTPGIAMVAKAASAIMLAAKFAVSQVSQKLGYTIGPEPGAEVMDKEPGTDE